MLRPDSKALFDELNNMAATGDYDVGRLQLIRQSPAVYRSKETVYYLASLFLQSGDSLAATELLAEFDTASTAMKRYFHVLSHSRRENLPVPKLTKSEVTCIEFLESSLNIVERTFESLVLKSGGFSIVGNAPGKLLHQKHEGVRLYFNSYEKNSRITETASIHVVTPSWDKKLTSSTEAICITGNDIFYRRSRVWQKFEDCRKDVVIYTVPADIWNTLYKELGTSPSAGLLILYWVEAIAACSPGTLKGFVAGFSSGRPKINHSYDAEPASNRHNWEAETLIRERLLDSLKNNCLSLSVET